MEQNDSTAEALVWFAVLERARIISDSDKAAQARRELGRMGITITYTRREGRRRVIRKPTKVRGRQFA